MRHTNPNRFPKGINYKDYARSLSKLLDVKDSGQTPGLGLTPDHVFTKVHGCHNCPHRFGSHRCPFGVDVNDDSAPNRHSRGICSKRVDEVLQNASLVLMDQDGDGVRARSVSKILLMDHMHRWQMYLDDIDSAYHARMKRLKEEGKDMADDPKVLALVDRATNALQRMSERHLQAWKQEEGQKIIHENAVRQLQTITVETDDRLRAFEEGGGDTPLIDLNPVDEVKDDVGSD
ncbi:MAG: hypothetical protein CUN57_00400 [Phototrophicales bacterium]|nr:MAG: hypothetical protein CUN57_00400 [Phototrophicales bacterium]